jgi:Killing trait
VPRRAAIANPAGTSGTLICVGAAPSQAMAMCDLAMAASLSMAMANAVANQQRGQVIAQAALTQVLTLIITKGASSS